MIPSDEELAGMEKYPATKIDDGGLAFPRASGPEPRVNTATDYQEGMSLRTWFAGQAMAGLIHRGFKEFGNSQSRYAEAAVTYADALIAALKVKP